MRKEKAVRLALVAVSHGQCEKGIRFNASVKKFPSLLSQITYKLTRKPIAHEPLNAVTSSLKNVLAGILVCFRTGTLIKWIIKNKAFEPEPPRYVLGVD